MQKQMIGLAALATLVMALIWVTAPRAAVTLNAAGTDLAGIDLLGLTGGDDEISAQRRSAHSAAP
jgi:hypothetical protein